MESKNVQITTGRKKANKTKQTKMSKNKMIHLNLNILIITRLKERGLNTKKRLAEWIKII